MKKLYVLIFLLSFFKLYPQWSSVNVGTTQDLYSVDYYTLNDIWIGSYNQIVKTNNAGTNWTIVNPIKDGSNVTILPANMYDLALTSTSSAIATGLFFTGNDECILNSTNSGLNWNIVSLNNTVPLLRYISAVDVFSSNAVAVGNNGRIAYSVNSGTTWTFVSSGTTNLVSDVKYATQDTLYAAGDNVIMRSVNGGLNWTKQTISGGFRSVSCDKGVVYIGDAYNQSLKKSTNYGVSYSTISLPFAYSGKLYAINKDTILAAGNTGLYISKSGGQYWEKYVLSGYQKVNMLDFNGANGYAVGDVGYAIKTSNISNAPSLPITTFSTSGTVFCLGDSVVLTNTTAPLAGYTYKWKVNGSTFSTQYNSGLKLNTEGTQTLTLVVTNGFGSDSASTTVTVNGHSMNPLTINASADTVCKNTIVGFSIPNSENGVVYRLRKGFVNIGASQTGNGSTLSFSAISSMSVTTTYNIKAVRTNACFTDSLVQSKTVVANSVNSPTISCIPANNFCSGSGAGIVNVSFNGINNTTTVLDNNYFDYSCCQHTDLVSGNTYSISITGAYMYGDYVKVWIDYNGDGVFNNATETACTGFANPTFTANVVIPAAQTFNVKTRMRVASEASSGNLGNPCSFSCGQIEDYSIQILPAPVKPTPSFTLTLSNACSTSSTFTNTTYNATSYLWKFGDGATSTLMNPPMHTYGSTAGVYTVTLIACNIYGCDSVKQNITNVIPPTPVASVCNPTLTTTGSTPKLTMYQNPAPGGHQIFFSPTQKDYTCTEQIYLMKDSSYFFYLDGNGQGNYFTMYLDFNNDGIFSYPSESCLSYAQNYQNIGVSGYSPVTYFIIPNMGIDSVPLRMRMIMSTSFITNICSVTNGDYKDITVYLTPHPLTTGFTVPSQTVCATDSAIVNFTNTSKGASSYLWDFGDGKTSTAFEPSHTYAGGNTYTVKLKTFGPNSQTDSLTKTNFITTNAALPSPAITLSGTVLSTTVAASSYQWLRNNAVISGATGMSYTLTQDGNYKLDITNSNGCVSSSTVIAYFPPHPSFTMNPTIACDSSWVVLTNLSTNATTCTINWGDGSAPFTFTGGNGFMHVYGPGTYSPKLIACNATSCDSMVKTNYVYMSTVPAIPLVTFNGSQFTTNAIEWHYQWYLNYAPILNDTTATCTPSQDGDYYLEVSNPAGCSGTSAIYSYYPIHIGFTSDTTAHCGTPTASISFYDQSVNATSTLWDFGDGDTSTLLNPVHVYTSPGTFTVKLKVCNATTCDSLTMSNYITIDANPVVCSVTPIDTTVICYGSQVQLHVPFTTGSTYQWQQYGSNINGANDTTYTTGFEADYNVVVTNSIGCVASSNISTIVGDYYCVWPGDANEDYQVDNLDLFPIGIKYGITGPSRTTQGNAWQGDACLNWNDSLNLYTNTKFVDCNGDGTINMSDTLAMNLNYTQTHPRPIPVSHIASSNYDIFMRFNKPLYYAGDTVFASVHIGDTLIPQTNFYGAAFKLYYDNTDIVPGSEVFYFNNSWVGNVNSSEITFNKLFPAQAKVEASLVRTTHTNVNGYGKVATLRFILANNISNNQLYFTFDYPTKTDSAGLLSSLSYDIDTAMLVQGGTAVNQLSNSKNPILIYPNPANTIINVVLNAKNEVNEINITNILGEQMPAQITSLKGEKCSFDVSNLQNGVYFVNIKDKQQRIIATEKIVIQH